MKLLNIFSESINIFGIDNEISEYSLYSRRSSCSFRFLKGNFWDLVFFSGDKNNVLPHCFAICIFLLFFTLLVLGQKSRIYFKEAEGIANIFMCALFFHHVFEVYVETLLFLCCCCLNASFFPIFLCRQIMEKCAMNFAW